MTEDTELITIKQAALLLDMSYMSVMRRVWREEIEAHKPGVHEWLVSLDEVKRYAKTQGREITDEHLEASRTLTR